MPKWLFPIVLWSMGIGVTATQIPASQAVIDDPEAYAVYASLLPREAPIAGGKAKRLVLQRETVTNNECTLTGAALETDWKPVVDDFKLQNAHLRFILPDRDLHYPYTVVPRRDILALFAKGGGEWPAFYQRYPDSGGYIEVSAVGFDRSKTRAMVYMAHHCGGLCGGGTHHLMEKVNGAWRTADVPGISACMWIS